MLRRFAVVGFVLGGLSLASAADTPPAEKVVHSKISEGKKCCGAACTVDFAKDLGVPLAYLGSIGHRISVARSEPDPVDLALAAQALGVAEKVSGKKSSITSEQVLKEALELVKQRGYSSELAAVIEITPDATTKKDLGKDLADAKKREEEAKTSISKEESAKELYGTLSVVNHSGECLRIYVSGRYVGEAHQGQQTSFHVHDHNNPTHIDAICEHDGQVVSHKDVWGHQHNVCWHIH